jgi:drug/metabolite transporter (DMT)-like permease
LVRTTSASVLGLSTMAIPVVGVLSTVWLMGIRPTTLDTIALGFILASLIVTYLPNLVSTFNSTSRKNNE